MAARVDLNADLGEMPGAGGAELDDALLRIVTSANVACGGHAGDSESMRRVTALAVEYGVAIGAHVSYPDRESFGRRNLTFTPGALLDALRSQLEDLFAAAADAGSAVRYIKPHGALYNASVVSDAPAALLVEIAQEFGLPVLTQQEGRLAQFAAEAGVAAYSEFFADRAYEASGRLRPRDAAGSVIGDPGAVVARVVTAVRHQTLISHDGQQLAITVDSVCVHSDTPAAARLAQAVRHALESAPFALGAFVDDQP